MWWHIHQQASQRTMRHGNRVKTGCKNRSQSWWSMSAFFFLWQNLRFGVEVSGDGFVSSPWNRSLSRGARRLSLWIDFSWGDMQETKRGASSATPSKVIPPSWPFFFSFRRLTSRSWKWPMLGIYMTKLMGIPCELKRPWRHLAWMISDSPFFWGKEVGLPGTTPEKAWKSLGLLLLVLFSGIFEGWGDFLVANWCRCAKGSPRGLGYCKETSRWSEA